MKSKAWLCLSIATIFALSLPVQGASAGPPSPFVGHWRGIDVDGSDIRLTIGGPPAGPFRVTWTESYISFCDGEAGILRGTGALREEDSNFLEADLWLECFTTGESMELHLAFRYHSNTDALSTYYDNGMRVVFRRPGNPQLTPSPLGLRVNYGHDWVEGFYDAGHTVWLAVTESDGVSVKATAEVVTEPKDFWDGEVGFATQPEDWIPSQPDIRAYDRVYGWVDNGASAQVQIGEINGAIDLEADSIRGTVLADWFAEELYIVCDPWGLSDLSQYRESSVYPDGVDEFECSWSGSLDILPGQELGVWYYGPDGHAVANAFSTPDVRIIAFPEAENVFGYGWPEGSEVHMDISGSSNFAMLTTVGPAPWDENDILAYFDFYALYDLVAGDVVTLSGSGIEETHVVRYLAVTGVDAAADTVTGIADDTETPHVYLFEHPDQVLTPTVGSGTWLADFSTVGFDLVGGTCGRADIWDEAGNSTTVDWCVPNPEIRAWLGNQRVEGYLWPAGEWITLEIYDPETGETFGATAPAEATEWGSFVAFSTQGWSLQPGQKITMTGAGITKNHTVLPVSITIADPNLDFVEGTASPDGRVLLCVYDGGCDPPAELFADASGYWSMDYSGLLDIQSGGGMDATEFDEDGDGTSYVYWIPDPRMIAFPVAENVFGYGWPEGSVVHLGVSGSSNFALQTTVGPAPWDPNDIVAYFDFYGLYDLRADDIVTLSGSGVSISHTVRNLTVDEPDPISDTVSGTADDGAIPHVYLFAYPDDILRPTAEGGVWLADFGSVGIDLVDGACGRVDIWDDLSNSTTVDWCVPVPEAQP